MISVIFQTRHTTNYFQSGNCNNHVAMLVPLTLHCFCWYITGLLFSDFKCNIPPPNKLTQVAMLLICIQNVPESNPGLTEVFWGRSQSLLMTRGILLSNRPWPFPSTSYPNHHSLINKSYITKNKVNTLTHFSYQSTKSNLNIHKNFIYNIYTNTVGVF